MFTSLTGSPLKGGDGQVKADARPANPAPPILYPSFRKDPANAVPSGFASASREVGTLRANGAVNNINAAVSNINAAVNNINAAVNNIYVGVANINAAVSDTNAAVSDTNAAVNNINGAVSNINAAVNNINGGVYCVWRDV